MIAKLNLSAPGLPSPCYLLDEAALERNLRVLAAVRSRSGASILLALKGFAMFSLFPLIRRYLDGVCASSLDEARLGREEFGKEVHLYAPAYRPDEFSALLRYADHLVFNSLEQWERFRPRVQAGRRRISCGLRINPEHSEVKTALYDPCGRFSRLGSTAAALAGRRLDGLEGLHFHTLCELDSDALERTLAAVEAKFGPYLDGLAWVNFGGGHHITRPGYDRDRLVRLVRDFAARHRCRVYLEPGEAVALNAGVLVATVLEIARNEMEIAILDTSAAAHLPDVLEMPYRPRIAGAGEPGRYLHTYRLAGLSCLAGDVIGDYSFPKPLRPGDRIALLDMGHYTMVKNNTFNGVRLPAIAIRRRSGRIRVVRRFGYSDYRGRLS